MGFTLRFLLGTVLVLSSSWPIQATETGQNGEETEKLQQTEAENITRANLSEDSAKPKTDFSTEDNKTIVDNQNSVAGKLKKSEPYKTIREDIARSIDVDKYVSKDFHSKNNVYSLPVSADTEKFIDPDYDFHGTTHKHDLLTAEFQFDSDLTTPKTTFFDQKFSQAQNETQIITPASSNFDQEDLTTPKSTIFDDRYKEAVESVDQKLEHIDDSHEELDESESIISLEKLVDETRKNDTKADLDYINYKNIISNDTASKNSLHKDLVVEAGTNLQFRSDYNHTTVLDETDSGNNTIVKEPEEDKKVEMSTLSNLIQPVKDLDLQQSESLTSKSIALAKSDLDHSESSTSKSSILTTRKSIVLTKPPTSNSSHISILSNNIETETVKAINPTTEKQKEIVPEVYTRRTPINITKRGSIKLESSSTEASTIENNIKKTEESLQENQVVPVPISPSFENYSTTTEEPNYITITSVETSTRTEIGTHPTIFETTTEIETSTTEASVEVETEPTTTVVATTETIPTETETVEVVSSTTEPTTETMTTTLVEESTTVSSSTFMADSTAATTTTEETTTVETPTTTEALFETTVKNITTETTVRTSKGLVFRDSTVALETVSTTEVPTTEESKTEIFETTKVVTTTSTSKVSTISDEVVEIESTTMLPKIYNRTNHVPETRLFDQTESSAETENTTENHTITSDSYELNTSSPEENGGTIAAITISSIGAVCLIILAGLLVIMRKRQKRFNYGQRCTPVSLDDYSMDNVSVYNSVRRKGMLRGSKRSYGNPAFEDPVSVTHPLNFPALGKFAKNLDDIKSEFEEIPQITARTNELPEGCDTKNRYANVIPLPETRVFLSLIEGYPNSDYINANYVTGPKNTKGYYIACQAPMQNTVDDFWRMIWEQQSKVILMLTHLFENGVEKCVDYLPPSEVLDCHRLFGDFQVTLKKREVKDKYIISILQLKNMVSNSWREVTHFWYLGWPEKGVPLEANSLIAFLIEARSYMKSSSLDRKDVTNGNLMNGIAKNEINPVVVHCSPGTGRTGVVIACDIAIREFEQTRLVDVPRIVYKIRRDRASAVQTKEQYAFIYKVINLYATKLTGGALDSL